MVGEGGVRRISLVWGGGVWIWVFLIKRVRSRGSTGNLDLVLGRLFFTFFLCYFYIRYLVYEIVVLCLYLSVGERDIEVKS